MRTIEISSVHHGVAKLRYHLERARNLHFLIVLDDIDREDQLDALLPEGMLSSGSLVIITSRDQSVLRGADIRYKMKEMGKDHAKLLFCRHAFRGQDPPIAYEKLVENFVEFCGGLPLSLMVLGAHVYRRDEHYWELELEKVRKIQPKDIMQRLKISFDSLDREEKQIFIDIACFFNKKEGSSLKSDAITIWQASGWSAEHAVQTLQDKCLLELVMIQVPTVKPGPFFLMQRHFHLVTRFEMHDHLCDLGRQMVDDLSPPRLLRPNFLRSMVSLFDCIFHCFEMHDHLHYLERQMTDDLGLPRLWRPDVLKSMEAKGFKQILAETKGRCFHEMEDSSLQTRITYFIGSSNDSTETNLLWLYIHNYQSEIIPAWIPLRKLYILAVNSVGDLWSTFQKQLQTNTQASFELRVLKIFNCPSLEKLPDLIVMFNHLEELDVGNSFQSTDLTSFVQSLKQLSNLRSLSLWSWEGASFSGNLDLSTGTDSANLGSSTRSRMNRLETIKLGNLENISKLLISGEICPRLQSLKVGHMGNLEEMHLEQLERLNTLDMEQCPNLETISGLSSLTGLQVLKVEICYGLAALLSSVREFQSLEVLESLELDQTSRLSSLTGLESLRVRGCLCETISELSSLTGLRSLELSLFFQLETISGLASLTGLQSLEVSECFRLKTISELASLTGLQSLLVRRCDELETISELSSLAGLKSLEVLGCPKLKTISSLSSPSGLQMFKVEIRHLEIEMSSVAEPNEGYAWVQNCINGRRPLIFDKFPRPVMFDMFQRPPLSGPLSGYVVLTGMPVDAALFELNANLFSEVIDSQRVIEIEKGEDSLGIESSYREISIYALLVRSGSNPYIEFQSVITHSHSFPRGNELMITVLQTPHGRNDVRLMSVPIEKGFRARVNEGEEEKALIILRRIIDRLYRS